MHLTRQHITGKMPITRKGTKYVVRAARDPENSVPVLIAMRDILKLAKTLREVKFLIRAGQLKLNGRKVEDFKESIQLFNIFEADKAYKLILLPTKKFAFEETKDKERLCKVTSRTLVAKGKIQLNTHDGSNFISDKDIAVGDSIYVAEGKVKKHVKMEKGSEVFVFKGKYTGLYGKIVSLGEMVDVKFKDSEAKIPQNEVIVI